MPIKSVIVGYILWLTVLATFFQSAVLQVTSAYANKNFPLKSRIFELTPETIRFADIRCQADSQNASTNLKTLWNQRIYPNNKPTYFYIKCFLNKLGLIDLKTRGLNLTPFAEFLEKSEIQTNDICLEIIYADDPLDGSCYSYYNVWLNFTKHCEDVINLVLYDQKNGLVEPDDNPRWKEPGETATQFCETELARTDTNVAAEISFAVDESFESSYKCLMECIFRHFHYFDAYGRLDENEVRHSFEQVHLLTQQNAVNIRYCVHRGNSLYSSGYCEMAYELNSCLQNKMRKNFLNVYQELDKKTKDY